MLFIPLENSALSALRGIKSTLNVQRINPIHLKGNFDRKFYGGPFLIKGAPLLCNDNNKHAQWGMLTDSSDLTFIDLSNPEISAWISRSKGSISQPHHFVIIFVLVTIKFLDLVL